MIGCHTAKLFVTINDRIHKKRIVFNYVNKDYKLISFPEFKKMIMSDKKYTKQDWLDGKVALNITDLYLLSAFVKDCNPNNSNFINSNHNIDDSASNIRLRYRLYRLVQIHLAFYSSLLLLFQTLCL